MLIRNHQNDKDIFRDSERIYEIRCLYMLNERTLLFNSFQIDTTRMGMYFSILARKLDFWMKCQKRRGPARYLALISANNGPHRIT